MRLTRRVTEVDVEHWEARVEHELRDHPSKLSLFRYDPPRNVLQPLTLSPAALGRNPLKDRMRRRLIALEKVIRDTP
jgi:hypothetical protein